MLKHGHQKRQVCVGLNCRVVRTSIVARHRPKFPTLVTAPGAVYAEVQPVVSPTRNTGNWIGMKRRGETVLDLNGVYAHVTRRLQGRTVCYVRLDEPSADELVIS